MIARVVLPLPLDKAFDYLVPEAFTQDSLVGCRAVVPFGRRILTGVIVDTLEEQEPNAKLKSIHDILDTTPSITPELLKLTRWISEYYMCSWGEAIRASLPSGIDYTNSYTIYHNGSAGKPERA